MRISSPCFFTTGRQRYSDYRTAGARRARTDATAALAAFEAGQADLDEEGRARLIHALEQGDTIVLTEDRKGGAGVRLTFTRKDVRAVNRLKGEGGPVGTGDV